MADNLFQRLKAAVFPRQKTEIAKAAAPLGGVPVNFGNGYQFYTGGHTLQEPFTQAWQKNMEGKNYRAPSMLAFSAVYACITIISQDVSKMTMNVMVVDPSSLTRSTTAGIRVEPPTRIT